MNHIREYKTLGFNSCSFEQFELNTKVIRKEAESGCWHIYTDDLGIFAARPKNIMSPKEHVKWICWEIFEG